jgi:predicted permease
MRPGDNDLDDEIRGHLAINVKERIERGQDPEAARFAAMREFGNLTLTRDEIRGVWRPRWIENGGALLRDIRFALRALMRVKGMAATVVITLALGIGANAAIFSVVRGVLLRPLVNRDEDRLIYIRQGRPDVENLNFSVPEIDDLKGRVISVRAFGDFSTLDFTLIGLGSEPRSVKSGVVSGSFFDVMGLRPVLGRLLDSRDDGPGAQGAVVLTYRFWTRSLNSDPTVIGRKIRLGPSPATIVGVLEPSVPYPADTEIIANVVTSPHHLGATMKKGRTHRMTELFARLAPGTSIESARVELTAAHAAMVHEYPGSYSKTLPTQLTVTRLRDQIAAPARTVLLVLLLTAAVVFVIACSNVANLILARSVRREGELAVRAALGAGSGALRRTLLAESLVLCGAGAILGVLLAQPMVTMISAYAARFSIRALEVRADASVLWVGAGLSLAAAVLLAYVPRLPSSQSEAGLGLASGTLRMTAGTNRRLRLFATMQIACSFVLLAGASTLLTTLVTTQTTKTGYTKISHVIAIDVPAQALGVPMTGGAGFFREAAQRIGELPGVEAASFGNVVPWRDPGAFGGSAPVTAEGYTLANGEEPPLGRIRTAGPHFFKALGIPLLGGREFTAAEREPVAIVSQMAAQRLFPDGEALNRHVAWAGMMDAKPIERRIVGVVADVDDENMVRRPALTLYEPSSPMLGYGGRLFVRTTSDPYSLMPSVTRVVRALAPDQSLERAATLQDIRAELLSPERVNAFVFSGFAGIALLIAIVGVGSVLAFSVSARTREFGVRLAVGSAPSQLLWRVVTEGIAIAAIGIAFGAGGGWALARVAARFVEGVHTPGPLPIAGAAALLFAAAVTASMLPAARASRIDVLQSLRSE